MRRIVFTAALLGLLVAGSRATAQDTRRPEAPALLQLEAKIPLGDVRGRIDHLSVDINRNRLFVAELGNNSIGVVDLKAGKLLRTISGFKEPQGVAYVSSVDMLYVANAGDGSVRIFSGEDYKLSGRIDLGDDADNIRVSVATNRVFVGYGDGGLATIDPVDRKAIASLPLQAHPEGFQISDSTNRIFVNLPNARSIAVVDMASGQKTAEWTIRSARSNFPMALDEEAQRVLVIFRSPAKLGAFAMQSGAEVAEAETCGDADDVFVDARRKRAYVSCGAGFIDIFGTEGSTYRRLSRVPTASGARTSLFVPALDRLLLAVRATGAEPAAVWVYRPAP
jgi:DNA-binding beta-propeller fold protein YncE